MDFETSSEIHVEEDLMQFAHKRSYSEFQEGNDKAKKILLF